jgi:predicted membrane protein
MSEQPTTYGLPKKREEVIEELKIAFANQNLDDQEYERRLNEASAAKSIEDLMLVLFDFPAEIKNKVFSQNNAQLSNQSPDFTMMAITSPKLQVIMGKESRMMPEFSNSIAKISTILGEQNLDFRLSQIPQTPINIHVESILGATIIDLRNENLDGKHINIHVTGGLGEVKILLPRGVSIQKNIQLIAGDFKIQDKQRSWIKRLTGMGNKKTEADIQLTVNFTGVFWFGSIKVIY